MKDFAALQKIKVRIDGRATIPPSLWRWDGLVRTSGGVYEVRIDLSQKSPFEVQSAATEARPERLPIQYRFYPEAPPNAYIKAAKDLPQVQKVLWFDRFPVTRYHQEAGEPIVEISDLRFPRMAAAVRPSPTASASIRAEKCWIRGGKNK